MDNFMKLKIKAISENEAFARNVVAAFCTPLNPTVDELADVKTAVSEAVTNSVVHGYDGRKGEVEIRAEIKGNSLHIEVSDNGVGIKDIEKAMQPFYTTKPDEERTGMGFTVMESFMDGLEVSANDGGGLRVRMFKRFDCKKDGEDVTDC